MTDDFTYEHKKLVGRAWPVIARRGQSPLHISSAVSGASKHVCSSACVQVAGARGPLWGPWLCWVRLHDAACWVGAPPAWRDPLWGLNRKADRPCQTGLRTRVHRYRISGWWHLRAHHPEMRSAYFSFSSHSWESNPRPPTRAVGVAAAVLQMSDSGCHVSPLTNQCTNRIFSCPCW